MHLICGEFVIRYKNVCIALNNIAQHLHLEWGNLLNVGGHGSCEWVPSPWNLLNLCSTYVHWLNIGGDSLSPSFGNLLRVRGISAHGSHFSIMQCLFDQPLC